MPPGVKGLAAMFEQQGATSPPDPRGRSPNLLSATPPLSDSPRPLSKIRTQFVAVEKDGRLGLTRGISTDSIGSVRKPSDESITSTPQPRSDPTSDPFTETPIALKNVTSNPTSNSASTPQSRPASPEKPIKTFGRMSPLKNVTGTSTPEVMPNPNPDKITDEEETKAKLQPGLPTDKLATRSDHSINTNGIGDALTSTKTTEAPAKPTSAPKAKPAEPVAPKTEKPAPTPVSTEKTANKPMKSPLPPKAPKSPVPPKAPRSPTKEQKAPTLAPTKKTTSAPPKETTKESQKPTAPPSAPAPAAKDTKKPASLGFPSNGVGFVKPKVKSPTRPVQLPAGLMAHTSSSSSKTNGAEAAPSSEKRRTSSGRSQSVAPSKTSQRPASRVSNNNSTAAPAKTLRRSSSTIHGGRQSIGHIGPPPKKSEQPATKKAYDVDESFLARMMRPTQSSASKATQKAPVTPPRKQHVPPSAFPKKAVEAAESAKKTSAKLQAAGGLKTEKSPPARARSTELEAKKSVSRERSPAPPKPKTEVKTPAKSVTKPVEKVAEKPVEKPVEKSVEKSVDEPVAPKAEAPAPAISLEDQLKSLKITEQKPEVAKPEPAPEPEIIVEESKKEPEVEAVPETAPEVSADPLIVEDIEDVVHDVTDKTLVDNTEISGDSAAPAVAEDAKLPEEPKIDAAPTLADEELISF